MLRNIDCSQKELEERRWRAVKYIISKQKKKAEKMKAMFDGGMLILIFTCMVCILASLK